MAKRPEKPTYAFIRKGLSLVPELDMDVAALDGIANGERVRVELKQWRNSGRNRAYWAMMNEVVQACGLKLTPEKLHEVAKLKNGVIELVMLPDGTPIATPGSIAFDTMTESDFVDFFRKVEEWLAETFGWIQENAA